MKRMFFRISIVALQGTLCILMITVLGSGKKASADDPWPHQCLTDYNDCLADCDDEGGTNFQECLDQCAGEYDGCEDVGSGSGVNVVCQKGCYRAWGLCLLKDTPEDCGNELTQCISSCDSE